MMGTVDCAFGYSIIMSQKFHCSNLLSFFTKVESFSHVLSPMMVFSSTVGSLVASPEDTASNKNFGPIGDGVEG